VPGFKVIENSPAKFVRIVLFAIEIVADCKTVSTSLTIPLMIASCAKQTPEQKVRKIKYKQLKVDTFLSLCK
jgi:hypothetical protein